MEGVESWRRKGGNNGYDIDRVMEQLSLERSKAVISLGESKGTAYEFCDRCVLDAYEKAIAIVKGGVE
nr:MAG TPA: hypothetical protein [Caudoviricetes sp.]